METLVVEYRWNMESKYLRWQVKNPDDPESHEQQSESFLHSPKVDLVSLNEA